MYENAALLQRWIALLREWREDALRQRAWRHALRAEAGIDWDKLEGKKHFAIFPRHDVDNCRSDVSLQASQDSILARSRHQAHCRACFGCGRFPEHLEWIFFQSPVWTWTEQSGRAGWIVYCPECDNQVSFHRSRMS